MTVTPPQDLIERISEEKWNSIKGKGSLPEGNLSQPQWVEPPGADAATEDKAPESQVDTNQGGAESSVINPGSGVIKSKVFRLGDFVDTDAVSATSDSITLAYTLTMIHLPAGTGTVSSNFKE